MTEVTITPKLDWLFTATCKNGYQIVQTEDDCSTADPTKSAFYDVELMGVTNITEFSLRNPATGRTISIRFPSCRFSVDGFGFVLGDPQAKPVARVLYFRRNRAQFSAAGEKLDQSCTYHIGWQDDAGQKVTIAVH